MEALSIVAGVSGSSRSAVHSVKLSRAAFSEAVTEHAMLSVVRITPKPRYVLPLSLIMAFADRCPHARLFCSISKQMLSLHHLSIWLGDYLT